MNPNLEYNIAIMNNSQKEIYESFVNDEEYPTPHIIARAIALREHDFRTEELDPYLLKDMDKAVDYTFNALIKQKDICVVADYDADGATSCAIMVKGLLNFGQSKNNIHYFLPDRQIHGYGLQPSVIDDMLSHYPNVEVIITVDNGISAVVGVDYAVKKGIDVLVTDHHMEGDARPTNAVAIVNPNRKDCTFPSKSIAGCGVAFYLIWSLSKKFKELSNQLKSNQNPTRPTRRKSIMSTNKNNEIYSDKEIEIIHKAAQFDPEVLRDYLAIGTIADVVKLDGNNRLMVEKGLERIRSRKSCTGVKAIMEVRNITYNKVPYFSTDDIAFSIAPTINASGRLDDMTIMVRMFLSENMAECLELADIADKFNQSRKEIEHGMVTDAVNNIDVGKNQYKFSCALCLTEGHEGVIGIVASRIKEKLYRPTIIFVEIEEEHDGHKLIKGSGRSIQGLHIRDAIDFVTKKSPDCVIKYGGHAMAAGLTIRKDKLTEFQKYFDEYCAIIFDNVEPTMVYQVDENLDLRQVRVEDVGMMNMEVWGQGYTKPMYVGDFTINNQTQLKNKITGENGHLKLSLTQKETNVDIDAIWFRKTEVVESESVKLIYQLGIDFQDNLQLMVVDAMEL